MAFHSGRRVHLAIGMAASILLLPRGSCAAFLIQPYLQALEESSITIRWKTDTPEKGTVAYGLDTGMRSRSAEKVPSVDHTARLTGLAADTLYRYRVSSGEDSAGGTFRTMGSRARPFRFIAYGDNRSDAAAHKRVVDAMCRVNDPSPSFLLNTGDLTASGTEQELREFFAIEDPLLRRVPMYPCMGNHDATELASFAAHFSLPNGGRWYSLRYGNAAFHALDVTADLSPSSEQYRWFIGSLLADSADARIRHVVVWFHNPPYTTNTAHAPDSLALRMICPLLERFKVRLAFHGHNHCYEHSLVNGTHYVISGGGGAPIYQRWHPPKPWTVYREATLEFVRVDVKGDTMKVVAIKPTGAGIDSFLVASGKSRSPSG